MLIVVLMLSILHVHCSACIDSSFYMNPALIIKLMFSAHPFDGDWNLLAYMLIYIIHSVITGIIAYLLLGWNNIRKWRICIIVIGCPVFIIVYLCMHEFFYKIIDKNYYIIDFYYHMYGYYRAFFDIILFSIMQLYLVIAYKYIKIKKYTTLINKKEE